MLYTKTNRNCQLYLLLYFSCLFDHTMVYFTNY